MTPVDRKKIKRRIITALLIAFNVLLYSVIVPFLGEGSVHERARRTQCLNNMTQIGLAINLYAADHNGASPATLSDFIPYIGGNDNVMLFMCPSIIKKVKSKPPAHITELKEHPDFLGYDLLSSTALDGSPLSPTNNPILCERPGNHGDDGMNILFSDDHVAWWNGTLSDFARSNSLAITIRPIGLN